MGRRVLWVVALLGAVAGCSSDPPPFVPAVAVSSGEESSTPAATLAPMTRPAASDPAAVVVIRAALDAHTGNQPDLVKKLKTVHITRAGQGHELGQQPVSQKWDLYAAWPDRVRYRLELSPTQIGYTCRNRDVGWMANRSQKVDMTPEQLLDYRVDTSAEWLWMLFPLGEPSTVVASAGDLVVLGKPAQGVRVWADGVTDAVLYFDAETKLLAAMTFEGREGNKPVTKQATFLTNKPFGGVTLAEKVAVKVGNRDLFDWTMTGIEFLPAVDAKLFEGP